MATNTAPAKKTARSSKAEQPARTAPTKGKRIIGNDAGSTPAARPMTQAEKLDAYGIDKFCEEVIGGKMMTRIAEEVGVSLALLLAWLQADPDRSVRAREARKLSAASHEELAQRAIEEAKDPFELSRAKELAHHFRWKASKIDPAKFGDKLEATLTGPNGGPVQFQKIEREIIDPKT